MKDKDKDLDDLFKRGMEDPVSQTGYREEDWASLEQMLNKHTNKRKGMIFLLPVLGSVAALLLLFLGWWAFRPKIINQPVQPVAQVITPKHEANTGTSGGSIRQSTDHQQTPPQTAKPAEKIYISKAGSKGKTFIIPSAAGSRRGDTGNVQNSVTERGYAEHLFATSKAIALETGSIALQPINIADFQKPVNNIIANVPAIKNKIKIKSQAAFRPQYTLSVLAAPDINGVGSFQQGKVGTNVGLLFSAGASRKLTVSTGILYSVKPYLTNFDKYHTAYKFPVQPLNVTADCRMLDIPLNVGYQVYHKQQNKLSIGTGLSSYIMLHENYQFNYSDPYTIGPASYTVPHSSKYFFGVVNLNATYERQLNSKVGISVMPYLKLPLTNIGYSQVRLQTTGVAVGLSWNLNSSLKP